MKRVKLLCYMFLFALMDLTVHIRTAVLRKLFDIRFLYKHCNFSRG